MDDRRAPWERPPAPPPAAPASTAPAAASDTPAQRAEKAEAAAIRRRWITLGEALAVIAAIISALTLWNSWSERRATDAEKTAAESKAETRAATLVLKAAVSRDRHSLTLAPVDAQQTIQSQTIRFPASTGLAAIETTGDPRIEAGWFDDVVRKGDPPHGRPLRLPVAVTTRFTTADGTLGETTALYHVGYRIDGNLFGSSVALSGLSLIGRVATKAAQARLDTLRPAK